MIDLFNDSNNKFINTNIQVYNKNSLNDKALLYIFSPKNLNKQKINPLVYNFDLPFIEKIVDSIENEQASTTIVNNPTIASTVLPSSQPIIQNTDQLSNYYSFMLIVDGIQNFKNNITFNNLNNNNNNLKIQLPNNYRIIYLGFFQDEPYNPNSTYQQTPTFNKNAKMSITRKSIFKKIINISNKITNDRPCILSDQLNTIYDNEIFSTNNNPNKDSYTVDDNLIFGLSPEYVDYNVEGITGLSYNDSINVNDIAVESSWESPKHHIKNITSALFDSFYTVISEQSSNDLFENSEFKENAITFFQSNDNSRYMSDVHDIGFMKDSILLLGELIDNLDLDILIIKNQSSNQLSVVDANYISPETVYGSLIDSTVSSFLLKWGLSSVALVYDSYSNYLEVQNIESVEKCLQEELKRRFNNFWQNFRLEILPMLKINCGEFYLGLFSHISSDNIINLVFYDYNGLSQSDCIKSFNPIGGISNNQLGKVDHVVNNVENIARLLDNTSNSLF